MKVCAVVLGIPLLTGIVGIFSAAIDGTIVCMPLYDVMKKLERVDVACTELLGASESFTFHQENTRKEQALELCVWSARSMLQKHRFLSCTDDWKETCALSPTSVTRAQDAYAFVRVCPFALQGMQALPRVARNQLGADLKAVAAQAIDHDTDIKSCAKQVK